MYSKLEKEKQKQIQDRCQRLLTQMLKDEDNKYCVDCDAKGPRWASWNIGVFLCIRCAGIHRNLGVHISRVKSVNLDTWTPQQVVCLQQMGNSRARAVYEANLPDNFRRPQTDSSLEAFIRSKYERKKYIAREWVQPPLPKVNWDKELEEEAEKMKKKKREIKQTATSSVSLPAPSVIPQALPKPQSTSSPKSTRIVQQNNTVDLLEMDTPTKDHPNQSTSSSSDLFANFLDNTPESTTSMQSSVAPTSNVPKSVRDAEEESFFNQATVPTATKQKQLTTDSILALYGTPSTYNVPNNSMPQTFNSQMNALIQNYPAGSQNIQNGMMTHNNLQFGSAAAAGTVPFTTVIPATSCTPNAFYPAAVSQTYSPFNTHKSNPDVPFSSPAFESDNPIDNDELNHQMSAMNLSMQNLNHSQRTANSTTTGQYTAQNQYNGQQQNLFSQPVAAATQQWQ